MILDYKTNLIIKEKQTDVYMATNSIEDGSIDLYHILTYWMAQKSSNKNLKQSGLLGFNKRNILLRNKWNLVNGKNNSFDTFCLEN